MEITNTQKIRHKLVREMVDMCGGSGDKKREPLTPLSIGVHTLKEGSSSRVLRDAWGVVSKQGGESTGGEWGHGTAEDFLCTERGLFGKVQDESVCFWC